MLLAIYDIGLLVPSYSMIILIFISGAGSPRYIDYINFCVEWVSQKNKIDLEK